MIKYEKSLSDLVWEALDIEQFDMTTCHKEYHDVKALSWLISSQFPIDLYVVAYTRPRLEKGYVPDREQIKELKKISQYAISSLIDEFLNFYFKSSNVVPISKNEDVK
jgi:hypothetical protein